MRGLKKALLQYDFYSAVNQRLIDAVTAAACYYFAFQLRFDWHVPSDEYVKFWYLLPMMMFGRVLVSSVFGVYRLIWRYFNLVDALTMLRAHAAFSLILGLVRFAPERGSFWTAYRVPRSIIVLEFMLFAGASVSVRVLRRIVYQRERRGLKVGHDGSESRVVLIGAGNAGVGVVKELGFRRDLKVVGFLDDDPKKIGLVIHGLRVLGSVESLPSLIRDHGVAQVIITIARPPRHFLKRVWAICDPQGVKIRSIPALEEILQGKVNIAAFRDVQLSDLLGRETIGFASNRDEIELSYRGKRILITGGGGSIGSELACQLLNFNPEELVVLDKDENGLFELCSRLGPRSGSPPVRPVVADLRFRTRLESILTRFRPEVIFHAAAHKHVPLMEMNPSEAVLNNVTGTRNLVELACAHKVSRFVLISTDKAVRPTSVMGATKRICEMIVQAQDAGRVNGLPRFACVRFGNVVGSRGSVIPFFQEQIARGGPLTVTHPEMERFLMTIPEAVSLVIQAGTLGTTGETFVLDMGDPVHIMNLAHELIELSGLQPGRDIEVQITELRPGEKLKEELIDRQTERLSPTKFEKIGVIQNRIFGTAAFFRKIAALEDAAQRGSDQEIYQILRELDISLHPPHADERS